MGASGGPITKDNTGVETYATVFSIAPSSRDGNLIWTGSDDGFVFVTRDGGINWKNVTPPGLGDYARVSLVEASPFRAGTAYVAANRYQQDDFKPYVFRTDDYGATWTAVTNGVASNDFARAIREDPKRERLLYLGTEHGIYVSWDDGAKWEPLRQNLPDTPVHGLRVVSRTSTMQYKKRPKALKEIARELDVDLVVEGSVVRAGDRVRVTAQLIDAETDRHLWAQTFDRTARDVLALQTDVATSIVREMNAALTQ